LASFNSRFFAGFVFPPGTKEITSSRCSS